MSVIKYLDTTTIGASSETGIDTTWSIKCGASTGTAFPGAGSNWQGTGQSSDSTEYPPLVIDATGDNTAHNNMPPYFAIYYNGSVKLCDLNNTRSTI